MPRVHLPPGCLGFSDGDRKYLGVNGPGSYVNLEDGSAQLAKLRKQGYASAGLVDAGPEKFFTVRKDDGRWCRGCNRVWNRWNKTCPNEHCEQYGLPTVPEAEM